MTDRDLDECVACAQSFDDPPDAVALRAREPVTVAALHERDEHVGLEVAAVEKRQRIIRDHRPKVCRQYAFIEVVGAEAGTNEHVGAERHQHGEAELRIAADVLPASRRLAPEVRTILVAVWHSKRGAVDAVESEPPPRITSRTVVPPLSGRVTVEPLEWVRAELMTGFHQSARRRCP